MHIHTHFPHIMAGTAQGVVVSMSFHVCGFASRGGLQSLLRDNVLSDVNILRLYYISVRKDRRADTAHSHTHRVTVLTV